MGPDGVGDGGGVVGDSGPDVRDESGGAGLDDRVPRCRVPCVDLLENAVDPSDRSFESMCPYRPSAVLHLPDEGLDVIPHDRVPPNFSNPRLDVRHDVRLQHAGPIDVGRLANDAFPRRNQVWCRDERVQPCVQGRFPGVWGGAGVEGEEGGEEDEEDRAVEPSMGTSVLSRRDNVLTERCQRCYKGEEAGPTFDFTICSKSLPSTFTFEYPVTACSVVGATWSGPSVLAFLGTVGPA